MLDKVLHDNYPLYLQYLRHLVSIPSPFNDLTAIANVIDYCEAEFSSNLEDFSLKRDTGGNLIASPPTVNEAGDFLFLSAHADTATANPSDWDAPFHPFTPYEDAEELVARGVNDCKAGLAYQLFLGALTARGIIAPRNVFFTITFKEEGPGYKSSTSLGKAFGVELPVGENNTYFVVLENTVTAQGPVSLFLSEKSNYAISVQGTLSWCRDIVSRLSRWNPIFIGPDGISLPSKEAQQITQIGGHACSVGRDSNLLTSVILNAEANCLIWAGAENEFATIPSAIFKIQTSHPHIHTCVLSNRGFDSLEEVAVQLEGVPYVSIKDFAISSGLRASTDTRNTPLVSSLVSSQFAPLIGTNDGSTDASIVYSSLNPSLRKRFFPLVIGPGTRSQRNRTPPRLTHGKNETFDKQGGLDCVTLLTKSLVECGFIALRS